MQSNISVSNIHQVRKIQAIFRSYRVRKLISLSVKEFIGLGQDIEQMVQIFNTDYNVRWSFPTATTFLCHDFLNDLNIFEKVEEIKKQRIPFESTPLDSPPVDPEMFEKKRKR